MYLRVQATSTKDIMTASTNSLVRFWSFLDLSFKFLTLLFSGIILCFGGGVLLSTIFVHMLPEVSFGFGTLEWKMVSEWLDEMAMFSNGSQPLAKNPTSGLGLSDFFLFYIPNVWKKVGASLERASTLGALPRHPDYPLPQLLLLLGTCHIICLIFFAWYLWFFWLFWFQHLVCKMKYIFR